MKKEVIVYRINCPEYTKDYSNIKLSNKLVSFKKKNSMKYNNEEELQLAKDKEHPELLFIVNEAVVSNEDKSLSKNVLALWDTGSNHTHISRSVANALKLRVIGNRNTKIMTNETSILNDTVLINVKFGNYSKNIEASVRDGESDIGLFIGTDIIFDGCFVSDYENGIFLFKYN